ncbi:MAG: GH1 family beta-glucosidase [Candidatus Methylacidiphilales bacterium]|nr:GH1 family beta-glucosidase [Candidatus Methylacidiphilales bacterium]
MSFPKNFTWGAAAASYQIEGAWDTEGKGPSVWDMLCGQPGKVWEGNTGEVACDHYNRYVEDVQLMKNIGLKAYRLSVSWPRVIPHGVGSVNQTGLNFYDKLVDELLGAGIQPWVTLFHWDYPYDLFLRGGWLNSDSPKWFADYTAVIVDRLSDRVEHWMTLNEPQCFIGMGHSTGEHAPGLKLGMREVLAAGHNCLLAHGLSTQVIRSRAQKTPIIGWAPVGVAYFPAGQSADDAAAAKRGMEAVYGDNLWNNTWWGDPVVFGEYPEAGLRAYGKNAPRFPDSDMEVIKQPLDFYGCNIYQGTAVTAGPNGDPIAVPTHPGHPHTHFLWKRTPESLRWGPKFLAERYKLPIVVTENGLSCHDWVALDGRVHDTNRIDFLHRYLLQLHHAIEDGVDVQGYFQWSIMDNFEWAEGYKHRFGLVHVDYTTQERTLKDSAGWYSEVIRTNGENMLPKTSNCSSALPLPKLKAETLAGALS